MSGAIHLVAALVVIFGIPGLLVMLHYRIHSELLSLCRMLAQLRIATSGNPVAPPAKPDPKPEPKPEPRPDSRLSAMEDRIRFLEAEREHLATKVYDESFKELLDSNRRLEQELKEARERLERAHFEMTMPPEHKLTMWRSE